MKYPNLLLFTIAVFIAVFLAWSGILEFLAGALGTLGYLGALFVGMLFAFSFTAPLAAVTFYFLGEFHNPFLIALLGGVGAAFGDFAIFGFLKNRLFTELEELWERHNHAFRKDFVTHLFHTRLFHGLGLFLAGVLILSPLPDELGVAIFAYYNLKPQQLLPLSAALNGLGIFFIAAFGSAVS
ncbi:MAG: hypothetical protein A3H06_02195 [Candidatus Colwellbacteria bacterium RIFCSPLOWO2_12_FULL_44_13]|uniref:TVP38/TMEM64 family membrane protein n=3 Tax=Candidatus Colwelliibacteriota TaxID=1817904 RepID=A0A1G1Z3W9_9BACT|nr:MAG: hypothetical protein A3F24_01810 [Candidatus Colwellbacteria bacterium RIFCSPHIGHO2_12_FULL_44_17]OGY59351.1 MAG: hypothetical protein A3I31_01785 [Candidatus Colwellbacteria bacterium RIFCSPLOWO2_02_FULL_44_20b]OGY61231.1 MAG: hypothetical protein A3H06_02195 [Candidatus Colwellbacteria bacterium RIFCSPLOWO2_12_FULL_44_13]